MRQLERHAIGVPPEMFRGFLDTLPYSRKNYPGLAKYSQDHLLSQFHVPASCAGSSHNSMADADNLRSLFLAMMVEEDKSEAACLKEVVCREDCAEWFLTAQQMRDSLVQIS